MKKSDLGQRRISILIIAIVAGFWTLLVTLASYMSTTGLINRGSIFAAAVPLVISLIVTVWFKSKGGGWAISVVAICLALVPFAFLAFVAIQQLLFPFGLPEQQ